MCTFFSLGENLCYGDPCLYGGTCNMVNDDTERVCHCADGYKGDLCQDTGQSWSWEKLKRNWRMNERVRESE